MGKVLDYKCPSCGAPLKFNIESQSWKCDYCDVDYKLEELNNKKLKKDEEEVSTEFNTYNCPDCGATVVCDSTTSATFCIYCGNTSILKNRLSGEFKPSKIIPFKKTKEDAVNAFVKLKQGRIFMPNLFNDPKNVEKITGVYIPFWLYTIIVEGSYNVKGKRITSWTSGEYHYTKTDNYEFYRNGSMEFDKIPVDGATKFANDMMNSIEPFDFSELVDYDHGYLSGFLAEMYDVDDKASVEEANVRARNSAKQQVLSTISATSLVPFNDTLTPSTKKCEYVLLPVWMVNVKFEGKMHLFAMNGQTGEIIGNIPVDRKKVLMYSIIFIVCCALAVFLGLVIFAKGGIA